MNGYDDRDNGSRSQRNSRLSGLSQVQYGDTPVSGAHTPGQLSRTPSADRRLLRALTTSPETGDISEEYTPTPPPPVRKAPQKATHVQIKTPESERAGYDGTPNTRASRGDTQRAAIKLVTPQDSDRRDDWQAGKTVTESNGYMLRYEVACDVTFLVGDNKEEIRAHKYMLMSRSSVFFKSLVRHLGNMDIKINVPDVKPSMFREMLAYIYTDEFDIHTDNVTSMLYAAKKFSLKGLSNLCFRFLDNGIDPDNVCKIMEQAHLYKENGLYDKCLKYIMTNGTEVLKKPTFAELCADCVETIFRSDELRAVEEVVFEAAIVWANAACRRHRRPPNDETRREVLGKLLYQIRFPIMPVAYFTHKVSLGSLLSNDETLSIFQYFHGEEQQLPNRFNKYERNRLPKNLSENHEPIMLSAPKSPNMSRVARFRSCDGHWKQHGPPDAISFSCSQPIVLYGLELYGAARSSETYNVKIWIYDDLKEEVRKTETSIYTNNLRMTYDVYLSRPIRIPARRVFTVVVMMKGGPTVKGVEGETIQIADGVTFEFCNSNRSSNGTDVTVGQIPGLLFNKTQ